MFTGIVTYIGTVLTVDEADGRRVEIATSYDLGEVAIGASIACAGCCLTVVEKSDTSFTVDVSRETLSATTLGDWAKGTRINLETALKLGDELGGHLVSGHVDGVARLTARRPDRESVRLTFEIPPALARFIASKGSVAVDGVSLTVNEVDGATFGVNVIPHTLAETTLGGLEEGAAVNLEIDLLARYVARLHDTDRAI